MKQVVVLVGILSVISLLIFISGCIKESESPEPIYEDTVSCIANNSELYISTGCIACLAQARIFGEDFKNLNIIDCSKQSQKCLDAGILSVPTWIIYKQKIGGVQSIEKLKEVTGCK